MPCRRLAATSASIWHNAVSTGCCSGGEYSHARYRADDSALVGATAMDRPGTSAARIFTWSRQLAGGAITIRLRTGGRANLPRKQVNLLQLRQRRIRRHPQLREAARL